MTEEIKNEDRLLRGERGRGAVVGLRDGEPRGASECITLLRSLRCGNLRIEGACSRFGEGKRATTLQPLRRIVAERTLRIAAASLP